MFEDDLIVNLDSHLEGRVKSENNIKKASSFPPTLWWVIEYAPYHTLLTRVSITLEINAEAPGYRPHHLM